MKIRAAGKRGSGEAAGIIICTAGKQVRQGRHSKYGKLYLCGVGGAKEKERLDVTKPESLNMATLGKEKRNANAGQDQRE